MKVVELSAVKKEYALGSVTVSALNGVSLAIEQGEFVAIAGPSGSGKSTILNMIGCIDSPTSGLVMIDGREVDKLSDKELTRYHREKIGFIFQSFNLIPVLNVYENIEFPLLLKKNVPKKKRGMRPSCGLSRRWGWPTGSATSRTSFRAGSASGWPSPAPW